MFHTMFLNKHGLKYSAKLFKYFFKIEYEQLLKKLKFNKNDVGKTLLSKDIPINIISEATGLSIDNIKNLNQHIKK